jgi:hypothetical protein
MKRGCTLVDCYLGSAIASRKQSFTRIAAEEFEKKNMVPSIPFYNEQLKICAAFQFLKKKTIENMNHCNLNR